MSSLQDVSLENPLSSSVTPHGDTLAKGRPLFQSVTAIKSQIAEVEKFVTTMNYAIRAIEVNCIEVSNIVLRRFGRCNGSAEVDKAVAQRQQAVAIKDRVSSKLFAVKDAAARLERLTHSSAQRVAQLYAARGCDASATQQSGQLALAERAKGAAAIWTDLDELHTLFAALHGVEQQSKELRRTVGTKFG